MAWEDWDGTRKLRPRSRVIADMSVNFLERKVLQRGHRLIRIPEEFDDGTDAILRTNHPDTTEFETGQVDFQLKATDGPRWTQDGVELAVELEVAHLHFWYHQVFFPVILIVYDAPKHRAYWLDIQEYLETNAQEFGQARETEAKTMTVRVPAKNRVDVRTIDHFRSLKQHRLNQT